MSFTDIYSMGRVTAKNVQVDQSGLILTDEMDDTKTLTIKASGLGVGNVDLTLPSAGGALLTDQSALDATKVDGSSLPAIGGAADDADLFNIFDSSATLNKVMTGAELKTFVNAGEVSLPAGTSDQHLYHNGSSWVAATAGGDLTHSEGNFYISSNKVTTAMMQANSVDANALAPNAVVDANVAAGAAIAKSKLAALEIADADVAAGAAISKSKLAALNIADADVAGGAAIAYSKLALSNSVVEGDLANDAVTSAKIAEQSAVDYSNGFAITQKSSGDGLKRFKWTATDNEMKLEYTSDAGATWNTVQTWQYV